MKVVWNYDAGAALRERLAGLSAHGLEVAVCPESDDARLFDLLAEAEVLWHCLRPVDRSVLDAAPRLRLVQKIGVGVNTIDLEHARTRDIAVCNMPGTNSAAVAEHTLALMLAVLRRLRDFDRDLRAGRGWNWPESRQDSLGEIGGRTVGLVGWGGVPRALAPVLAALGATVICHTRTPDPGAGIEFTTLHDLLARADIVSLHVPLDDATHRMLDGAAFARMRAGAILVNTARGGLVDEGALVQALTDGPLAGAGLDVFAGEPIADGHPLMALDNVVLTPHVAWLTGETLARSLEVAVDNCRRLEAGEPLAFRVA